MELDEYDKDKRSGRNLRTNSREITLMGALRLASFVPDGGGVFDDSRSSV